MCNCESTHKGILEEQYEKEFFKTVGLVVLMLLAILSLFYIKSHFLVTLICLVTFILFVMICLSTKKMYEIVKTINWGKLNEI